MPTTRVLTAHFDHDDWQAIRAASMRGKLDASFTRAANGDVTFTMPYGLPPLAKFIRQINAIVDFGATTAAEIFDVTRELRGY